MTVYPIFSDRNEEQILFEICLTKSLAERQVNYLNKVYPNKKYYTYPMQVATTQKQLFKSLKE